MPSSRWPSIPGAFINGLSRAGAGSTNGINWRRCVGRFPPWLERLAASPGYREAARGEARVTVEEFVADWLLKERGWPRDAQRFVKVYFVDESEIPFPARRTLQDFLP